MCFIIHCQCTHLTVLTPHQKVILQKQSSASEVMQNIKTQRFDQRTFTF